MNPKEVKFATDSRTKIKQGVDILANAVKVTLGPRGRNVLIQRERGQPFITKDGVTVAKYIHLEDPLENMGATLIKSVASNANLESGDGTTTATVLAQAIYNSGLQYIEQGYNPIFLQRGINLASSVIIAALKEKAILISDKESLAHVATISANNDKILGKTIADTMAAIGRDGVLYVEESAGKDTRVVHQEGIEIERGYVNEIFINNHSKNTSEYQEPYVILIDDEIKYNTENTNLISIMNALEGRPVVLIVKNITSDALGFYVENFLKKRIACNIIKCPQTGDYRKALLEDLAVITGGKVFPSLELLKNASISEIGRAKVIISGPNSTKIIGGFVPESEVQKEVKRLKELSKEPSLFSEQVKIIEQRISRLSGGVAIFKVGGKSETEMREMKDRVEDAVNAVKSALLEGIIPGGGSAWIHVLSSLDTIDTSVITKEEALGIDIVRGAVLEPFKQILNNAGILNVDDHIKDIMNMGGASGYDAYKLSISKDMIKDGIIDPFKVTKTSFLNAVSVAGTLLTTEVSIYDKYEYVN